MSTRRELPILFLRLEGAVLLGLSVFLYSRLDEPWWLFAVLLLVPDAALGGYAAGSTAGAWVYNVFHTYLPPAALAVAGILAESSLMKGIALIWFAHIGMDRLFGFGLKHTTGFKDTHLGRIGKD